MQTKEIVIGTWSQVSDYDRRLWSDPEELKMETSYKPVFIAHGSKRVKAYEVKTGQKVSLPYMIYCPPISNLTTVDYDVPECCPMGYFCETLGHYTLTPLKRREE